MPGKNTPQEMEAYQKAETIEILANTKDMQVVRNKQLGIWQMVFYQAGEFKNKDITVRVDKGCALMIKDTNKIRSQSSYSRSGTNTVEYTSNDWYASQIEKATQSELHF